MPVTSDDIGQDIQRRLFQAINREIVELFRRRHTDKMMRTQLFEEAIVASRDDAPYILAACKNERAAIHAVGAIKHELDRAGLDNVKVLRRGKFISYPKSAQDIANEVLKREKVKQMVLRSDVCPQSKPPKFEWDSVALLDEQGNPLDPEMCAQIEGYLAMGRISTMRDGHMLRFHSSDRDRILAICGSYANAKDVDEFDDAMFDEVADKTVEESVRPASQKQLDYIDDLYEQGRISDAEMAIFSLSQSCQAAHDLITSKVGVEGWVDHGGRDAERTREIGERGQLSPSDTIAEKTRAIGDAKPAEEPGLSPDIARDAQAAMRREDIGNVETTADHVQSRPNAGDQDRSTPYPDQCDPAGAGDTNGDGIRDAAQDRDGDGVPDPEDPEGIGPDDRDAQTLCEQKTAEADYVDHLPKTRSADVSLQQETR